MLRRSFLGALSTVSTLPLIPDRLHSDQQPSVPSEGNLMFWFHFYGAIQREKPMSTERAREKTVEELTLQNLTDDEAVQLLELANGGVYEINDIPERWRSLIERAEKDPYT